MYVISRNPDASASDFPYTIRKRGEAPIKAVPTKSVLALKARYGWSDQTEKGFGGTIVIYCEKLETFEDGKPSPGESSLEFNGTQFRDIESGLLVRDFARIVLGPDKTITYDS